MNWINLNTNTLRSPAYVGAEPVQRATWLNVLSYCAEQENGGRIVGARAWKDRQWQQTCGVMISEVDGAHPLLSWEGEDLVVWSYPLDKEAEIQTRRENGRISVKKRWDSRANSTADSTPNSSGNTEGERKEKEKEKEKGSTPLPPDAEPATASPSRGGGGKKDTFPTTPEARAVAALFHRRLDTPWSPKEVRAFKGAVKRGVLTSDAMDAMAEYYAEERSKGDDGMHRRDLKTFLNNFDGELDRARAFHAPQQRDDRPAAFKLPGKPPLVRPEHAQ